VLEQRVVAGGGSDGAADTEADGGAVDETDARANITADRDADAERVADICGHHGVPVRGPSGRSDAVCEPRRGCTN
jgi:hypothetical protein